jgi:large subunit ribosomal protein L3
MTALYNPETGKRSACTILQLDRNEVIAHKTREKNGYFAVQVGAGQKQAYNTTRPMLGHFATARVSPKRWVVEFKVKGEEGLGVEVGQGIGAGWFEKGGWVDVKAVSRGKGFAGVCVSPCSMLGFCSNLKSGWDAMDEKSTDRLDVC